MNSIRKSTVHSLCLICILSLLNSCLNQEQIPFKNIPHIQYFNLKGKVAEVQVESFQCGILPEGYASPNILNMQNLSPIGNAVLLTNYIHKNEIDIFSIPIEKFRKLGNDVMISPMLSNISYSFDDKGYISDFSLYWKDKKIRTVECEYDNNKFPNSITQYELYSAMWNMIGFCEYHENMDTVQDLFQYDKSMITKFRTIKTSDSIQTIKTIYTFEKIGENKTLEKICYGNKYVDSAYILNDKNRNIFKIDYFQDATRFMNKKQAEATMFLENNIVYKVLPGISNKVFDNSHRLIEDENYSYTYDRNGLYKTIYDKKNDILSTVSYELDSQGNWIKMEIIPDRSDFDKKNRELEDLDKEFNYNIERYNRYENMTYPPIETMNLIVKNLEKINLRVKLLNEEISDMIKHLGKITIKRNILYY